MGWLWLRLGQPGWLRPARTADPHTDRGWPAFWASCRHDVVQAGGFLVIGRVRGGDPQRDGARRAGCEAIAANPVLSVIALALLAVLLSICSEADAFVAASLTQFSLTARLAFLVVGPMVDLKLFAMQVGSFGPRFAIRFAPATFVVAVLVSVLVGVGAAVRSGEEGRAGGPAAAGRRHAAEDQLYRHVRALRQAGPAAAARDRRRWCS